MTKPSILKHSVNYCLFRVFSILITRLIFWGFLPFQNDFLCSKFNNESNCRHRALWTDEMSLVYLNRIEVIKFSNFTLTTSFFWYDFSALHLSINFIHFTRQWCSNSVSFFSRYSSRISKFLTFLWKLSLQVLKEFDNWRKKYKFNVNYLCEYDFMRLQKFTSGLFSSIATVTSVFVVKGLFYSRINDKFCLFFTLKWYCLVALNYRRYKILRNTYF